nr:AI-2E family transporter [[Phormidium] sp. ETS-05]
MNQVFSPLQQFLLTWVLALLAGWSTLQALSYVGEPLAILVTASLVAFLLNYPVARLQGVMPSTGAAILVYLVAAVGVVALALTVVPPVFNQGRQLVTNLPSLLQSAQQQLVDFQAWSAAHNLPFDTIVWKQQIIQQAQKQVESVAAKGFGVVAGTISWFLDLILILVISFYLLLDGERVWQGLTTIVSPQIRPQLTQSLERNLQKFISGQLLLGLFMAISLAPAFWWLGVPYWVLFAVFIGVMEIIPFVGATLGIAAVCIIVAFINWWLAVKVLAVAIALQQVKDNLVAPRILGNLTGLSPAIILVVLLLGAKIGGLLGVLAIPFTGVVKSIWEIVLDPTLPPQTGSFFYNPLLPDGNLATSKIDN